MHEDQIRKETSIGTLYAYPCNDSDYPGILVGLERNGVRYEFAWVEVDQCDENESPVMKIHVFGTKDDDPVFDENIHIDEIKKQYMEAE